MGTCTRCGTPRGSGDRCSFCGASFVLTPPAAAAPAPAAAEPPAPATSALPEQVVPVPSHQPVVPDPTTPPPLPAAAPWEQQAWSGTTMIVTPPATPETDDATAVARLLGLVLGPYLGVCLVYSALLSMTLSKGLFDGPVDWFRGGVLLAALGLHSGAFARVGGDDPGSAVLTATPAVLLLGVLVLSVVMARREEQRTPSRNLGQAATRGALAGAGAALVLSVLALMTRVTPSFGVGEVVQLNGAATVGARALPLLLWGSALLATACTLGRATAHSEELRELAAARTRGVSEWLPFAGLHVVVTGVVLAGVAYGYAVKDAGDVSSDLSLVHVGGLLAYGLISLNAGLYGAMLLMGVDLKASAGESFFGGFDERGGLLHGDLSAGDLVWFVVVLGLTVAVGAAHAKRRPAAEWWHGGAAFAGTWLLVALLLRTGVSFSGGGQRVHAGFGPDLLLLPVLAFAYGCLAQHGGRVAAARLAA